MKRLLVALGMGFLASSAHASVMTATWMGTVNDVVSDSVFGAATGDAFNAVFTYDTTVGVRTTNATLDRIFGGTNAGAPTPIIDSSITINGITVHYSGNYEGLAVNVFTPSAYEFDRAFDGSGDSGLEFATVGHAGAAPPNLDTPFSRAFSGCVGCGDIFGTGYAINLTPTSLDVVGATAVIPEPSTWALMLTGFFGLGAALRSRRPQVVV